MKVFSKYDLQRFTLLEVEQCVKDSSLKTEFECVTNEKVDQQVKSATT